MKVRDSGMPEEALWATFFDAPAILARLGFTDPQADIAEFGCGYGTFTVAAAARTRGTVFAFDIEPAMLEATQAKVRKAGLPNVRAVLRDFATHGTGLADDSVTYALLFNILHAEQPVALLSEAARLLHPGGAVGVIHWNCDPRTPRGPALSIRPRPEQRQGPMCQAGFQLASPVLELPPYHFGLVGRKAHSPRRFPDPADSD
ncbi:MAG: class I SAM-dependent methyltransferase [Verrucomicrobiales bacterium]|nr:class I SAM-dependent methyltransferase [Verrucomicrobiales bacterium]